MTIDFNEIFRYEDGKLWWLVSKKGRRLGRPAGTNSPRLKKGRSSYAYYSVKVNGKDFLTHRVIWLMHGRPILDGMDVDHRNNNNIDNRIENLQLLTPRDNSVKTHSSGKNTMSGHKGILMYKKYRAHVSHKKFKKNLEMHNTVEEAYAAIKACLLEHSVSESEYISSKTKVKKRYKANENLPPGVTVVQKRFRVTLIKDFVRVYHGRFSTLEEAREAYKIAFIEAYGAHLYVES